MGGGSNNTNSSGDTWQQPRITPKPKEEEEITQKTKSDTNVPTEAIVGPGGPVQNNEQKPNDFKPEQSDKRDPCFVKPFDRLLTSPKAAAITSVAVGEVLRVISRGSRIEVLNSSGEPCGYVTDRMQLLFKCMDNGHTFSAEVLIADGGEMKVRIGNVLDK